MRRCLAMAFVVLIVGLAGGAVALALQQPAGASHQGDLHSFLHFGCKHHNHGRAWHRDHGRTLGVGDHRQGRPEPD